jgi:hypothetical protein
MRTNNPTPVVTSIAAGAGTYALPYIDTNQVYAISAQAVFSSNTSAGSFKLQASNDNTNANNLQLASPTNWNDIPNTAQTVTAGATTLIPFTQLSYRFIRVVFVATAAAGNMTITTNTQGF